MENIELGLNDLIADIGYDFAFEGDRATMDKKDWIADITAELKTCEYFDGIDSDRITMALNVIWDNHKKTEALE